MTNLGPPPNQDPRGSPGQYYDSIDRRGGEPNHYPPPQQQDSFQQDQNSFQRNPSYSMQRGGPQDYDPQAEFNRSGPSDFEQGSDQMRGYPAEYDRQSDRPSDYGRPMDYGHGGVPPLDNSREGAYPDQRGYGDYPEERQGSYSQQPSDFRPPGGVPIYPGMGPPVSTSILRPGLA